MKPVRILLLLGVVGTATIAGVIGSGVYNVGADDPHWPLTDELLDIARRRSIAVRAAALVPPDLSDPGLIRSGAGNYDAMCVSCHLSPGAPETELSAGLYPRPPRWDALGRTDPRAAFWVLKHGIKASGMPAWGRSMDDRYLWGMVAFLQQFPRLDAAQYRAQVAASEGHSHGGGETEVGGGDTRAAHHAKEKPRSSFEPGDDPRAMPAVSDHADGDHKH